MQLTLLDTHSLEFPDTDLALTDPDGLLAFGGDLRVERLLAAYQRGIFPWFSEGDPIYWWSPYARMSLHPQHVHIGKTLKKLAKKQRFTITVDTAFDTVIANCSNVTRKHQDGTWITNSIIDAYTNLHQAGYAHSIEAWIDGECVGGLYGVHIGGAFFGESMFSIESGASKVAFMALALQLKIWGFSLIDCQVHTPYLESFGANEIIRPEFEKKLKTALAESPLPSGKTWAQAWSLDKFGSPCN